MSAPLPNWLDTRETNRRLIRWLFQLLEPPKHVSTLTWANTERRLSPKNCAKPGQFSTDFAPFMEEILEAVDDPAVELIITMKPAQVIYTDGFICNVLGKRIACQDNGDIVVMFPRETSAKDFREEKFRPMVEVTPTVRKHVNLTRGLRNGDSWRRTNFGSGAIKLVGSNSPADAKSTSAPLQIVEEPDDAARNQKGQGDSILNLRKRGVSFENTKTAFGGTPTIKGLSQVADAYDSEDSDQRHFWVRCHSCKNPIDFTDVRNYDNLKWDDEDWETARYVCPHCQTVWTDNQRLRNIYLSNREKRLHGAKDVGWIAQKPFRGVAAFKIGGLMSPMPGRRHKAQVKEWLEAKRALAQGDDTKIISFVNGTQGEAYEYPRDTPPMEALKQRAEPYCEWFIPEGGIVPTLGVDVQHNRLACVGRTFGRGEESWLTVWEELPGDTSVSIYQGEPQGVWANLWAFINRPIQHQSGGTLKFRAVSIDAGDGNRSSAVYDFVRWANNRNGIKVNAINGARQDTKGRKEIYTPAKPVDTKSNNKHAKFGVLLYEVGTSKAKDLILGNRIKLEGHGAGVLHWPDSLPDEYWKGLLSEVKAPMKGHGKQLVWQHLIADPNEPLDGEVYALHALYSTGAHLWTPRRWDQEDNKIRQFDLLAPEPPPAEGVRVQVADPLQNPPEKTADFVKNKVPIHRRLA